jgi:transcription antitermination factor NusA-like protein
MKTIDMQDMRYLNLFGKITKVGTRFCFKYNENIVFCVPRQLVSKAVGEDARNIKQMKSILRKRIKIIPRPKGIQDARKFIEAIVKPVTFKDLEVKGNEIILTAGSQSKAALIGRNKRRLLEMQKIVKDFFGKEFRIV